MEIAIYNGVVCTAVRRNSRRWFKGQIVNRLKSFRSVSENLWPPGAAPKRPAEKTQNISVPANGVGNAESIAPAPPGGKSEQSPPSTRKPSEFKSAPVSTFKPTAEFDDAVMRRLLLGGYHKRSRLSAFFRRLFSSVLWMLALVAVAIIGLLVFYEKYTIIGW